MCVISCLKVHGTICKKDSLHILGGIARRVNAFMKIKVLYFASLREQMGCSERSIELQAESTVREVWRVAAPNSELPANILSAINMEYAGLDQPVNEGDEVAFFMKTLTRGI